MTLAPLPDTATLLASWTAVHDAVREAREAATPSVALDVLREARARLDAAPSDHSARLATEDVAAHLATQLALLEDLAGLVTATWASQSAQSAQSVQSVQSAGASPTPAPWRDELDLCKAPVTAGDALCLLRLGGTLRRADLAAHTPVFVTEVEASIRTSDEVVTIDDTHLLVVMRTVPIAVAWRRMTRLLGERTTGGSQAPVLVHAGLAAVGPAGPAVALEAARAALAEVANGPGTGWIALAPQAGPRGVA
ncbi:hypothetical protein [Nocardioides sp. SYSU DS0663]|uniref:hypothetical protein n=1 Tax=Nocardioides sp. SYSU DS0663 TaxID=3416445 RepID=UPI003F4B7B63